MREKWTSTFFVLYLLEIKHREIEWDAIPPLFSVHVLKVNSATAKTLIIVPPSDIKSCFENVSVSKRDNVWSPGDYRLTLTKQFLTSDSESGNFVLAWRNGNHRHDNHERNVGNFEKPHWQISLSQTRVCQWKLVLFSEPHFCGYIPLAKLDCCTATDWLQVKLIHRIRHHKDVQGRDAQDSNKMNTKVTCPATFVCVCGKLPVFLTFWFCHNFQERLAPRKSFLQFSTKMPVSSSRFDLCEDGAGNSHNWEIPTHQFSSLKRTAWCEFHMFCGSLSLPFFALYSSVLAGECLTPYFYVIYLHSIHKLDKPQEFRNRARCFARSNVRLTRCENNQVRRVHIHFPWEPLSPNGTTIWIENPKRMTSPGTCLTSKQERISFRLSLLLFKQKGSLIKPNCFRKDHTFIRSMTT